MKIKNLVLPSILVGATALVAAPEESQGFSLLGHSLGTSQADFRVFNNFIDAAANNNNFALTPASTSTARRITSGSSASSRIVCNKA